MIDSPFLVIGGGIAGLASALGLALAGRESRVFERAQAFEEVGAGLQLGPNAVAALQWLGVWETVAPHAFAPSEIHVRDGLSGTLLQRVRLGLRFEQRFGMPYRVALRSDLLRALVNHAASSTFITLETGCGAKLLDARLGIVSVDGQAIHGQGIVAADGVHSAARLVIQGTERKQAQSHTLYRKLMPVDACPPGLELDTVTLWLCPGGHIVHYLVAGGRQLNIVVSIEEHASGSRPTLPGLCDQATSILESADEWLAWPGFDLEPDPRWSLGRTVLVGDAAHAMLPYLAQGAAMALEDACTLAKALDMQADFETASQSFTQERFHRVKRMQLASRRQGAIYHQTGLVRHARNTALRLLPEGLFLDRLAWIYSWRP